MNKHLTLGVFLLLSSSNILIAQTWDEIIKLTASDAAAEDEFGHSVSISGDRAIVGALFDDDDGSASGSAYIFELSGGSWIETAKLTASDAASGDRFGYSVSISDDKAIVGAYFDDDDGSASGSAYIFELSGGSWIETAKLTALDAAANDRLGYSVSISGDKAIAGASYNDDGGSASGSAYIFELSGGIWTETAKLTALDAAANDQFGYSVSISDDKAIAGAYGNDDDGSASGSAYIFELSGGSWTEAVKLTASDAASGDQFGVSVAISGDNAIVGAFYNDDSGASSGSAYIFELLGGSWTETAKLTALDAATGDRFGTSVSISEDKAIVGANFNDDTGTASGSAYIFELSGGSWTETVKLVALDAAADDLFGTTVSVNGDKAMVGAFLNDDSGTRSGSSYIFTLCPTITASVTDEILCFGESVTFSGTGADTYSWDLGVTDGVEFYPGVGTEIYTVTGTDDNGCENTASIEVTVNELPAITASATDDDLCFGESLTFTGGGGIIYSWDMGVTDGIEFSPGLGTETYTVTGTDDNDCENIASVEVTVNELPMITASATDDALCFGESVTLTGGGGIIYSWDMGVTDGVEFSPGVGTEIYTVTGIDDNDCENTASVEVTMFEIIEITETVTEELYGDDGEIDIEVTGGLPAYIFDWDNDGTGDFDDVEDLTGLSGGVYIVTVKGSADCEQSKEIILGSQLNIEQNLTAHISVYPNPTIGVVHLNVQGEFKYEVLSLTGALLTQGTSNDSETLFLNSLASGTYLLNVYTDQTFKTIKLFKQ